MPTEEKTVLLQFEDSVSAADLDVIRTWLKRDKPEGYRFLISNKPWHAFTKEEMQPLLKLLKEKLDE